MIGPDELVALAGATEADLPALQQLERDAVAFVQTQTARYFGPPEEVTEYVTATGTRRLWLRDHVTLDDYDLLTVLVDEHVYPGGAATAITDAGFALRQSDREFWLMRMGDDLGVWTQGYEYAVAYWRGYPEGEEPGDIRRLVADLVAVRWSLRGAGGMRSETLGTLYSYVRFGDSDLDAVMGGWATINAWRRPVYA